MQKEDISLLRIYAKNDMNCVKTARRWIFTTTA